MLSSTMKKMAPVKSTTTKEETLPPKKMSSNKSAEKCSTCSCSTTKKSEPKASIKKTIIRVLFDCGFPNTLYIRGDGCTSLSWSKGIAMQNVSNSEWLWENTRPCSLINFKILINDEVYEIGENHTVTYGDELTIKPNF